MSLNRYTQKAQTECLERNGAFFAFNNSKFEEKCQENTKYYDLGMGLLCPQKTTETFLKEYKDIAQRGIEMDIEKNGLEFIIRRELANHECGYTGDISDALEALEGYPGVTKELVEEVFYGKVA